MAVRTATKLGAAACVGWLIAGASAASCSSFTAEDPASDDGATEGGDSPAEGAADSADTSTRPACEPMAIEPVDAGEDANCNGGGGNVVLETAKKNCGRCGHDCLDHQCLGGQCVVKAITSDEIGPPMVAEFADPYLFYTPSQADRSAGELRRVLIDGGSPRRLYGVLGGYTASAHLAQQSVFLIASPTGVLRLSPDGGLEQRIVSDPTNVSAMVTDETNVYWNRNGTVIGRPHSAVDDVGNDFFVHADPTLAEVRTIATDGKRVYLSARTADVDGGPPPTSVVRKRGPRADDNTVTLADKLPYAINVFAFDAEYIYWATSVGEVWRASKLGTLPPQIVTKLVGVRTYSMGLAVDDSNVYVNAIVYGDVAMDLYQAPKCGGPPRLLLKDETYVRGLLSVGPYLFWGAQFSLRRSPK